MSERFLNPRVVAVPPSGIRRFFDVAGTMKDAISLGVGEPDFITPYHIRSAAIDSILDGETQYTPNRGLLSLRQPKWPKWPESACLPLSLLRGTRTPRSG